MKEMRRNASTVSSLPSIAQSPKIRSELQANPMSSSEPLTMQQSFRNLSLTKSQLRLLAQALTNVSQEKATMADVTGRLKKRSLELTSECQSLKKNHDQLHNETVRLEKAHCKFESDRVTMEKELEQLAAEDKAQDEVALRKKLEMMELKAVSSKESEAVSKLKEMVARLKRELAMQVRQRESIRSETTALNRQIEQLRDRIFRLRSTNQTMMQKIQQTAQEFGASHPA